MSEKPTKKDSSKAPSDGSNDPRDQKRSPQPPTSRLGRNPLSIFLLLSLLILVFVVLTTTKSTGVLKESWKEFAGYLEVKEEVNEQGDVAWHSKLDPNHPVVIKENKIVATIKAGEVGFEEGGQIYFKIAPDGESRRWYVERVNTLTGGHFTDDGASGMWFHLLISFGPIILIIALIWFFIARSMRSAGAGPGGMLGSFGKSRHRISTKDMVNITFNDVAGVDEAKDEVHELVEFLKNPKKFQRLGGRIPRGVLLIGPPGCGKTLLAKAIAGEADVPFFSISGSDFVEMFVGVGASRVRDLFKQAKENSPCIIFLDEIDAVGRRRGGGFSTGGHDEREQTLNAILVEMDGFEANDQIIVIAATNRSDILDPALTRPGRFDRQVSVSFADMRGRYEILKVHAKKIKMGPDVDLERLARGTPMFSGADLAAIINEAAILATMANKDFVELEDLEEARDKVRFGRAQKSRKIEEKERIATAYHEAGHAVVQSLLEDADPVHKVTIIPRGQALGATMSLPEKDRYGYGMKFLLATMRVLCGGRIAEKRKTGDVSSGASMDIKQATASARHMILEWGMSDKLGFVNYSGEDSREVFIPDRGYSDETASIIDQEIKRLTDEAYADVERMIESHWDKVVAMSESLLKYETLTLEDVQRIMRGERMDKPTVAELLKEAVHSDEQSAAPDKPAEDEEPDEDPGSMISVPAWP